MLSGDNSILQKATDAKTLTERASVIEKAQTDILGYQAENKGTDLQKSQLKAVLDTYFKDVPKIEDLPEGEDLLNLKLETLNKYGTHTIKVSEFFNGTLTSNKNENINWEVLLADAVENPEKYKHVDQKNDSRAAIGLSGKPVNLDLWNIAFSSNGYMIQGSQHGGGYGGPPTFTAGYFGEINNDGKIQGEVPMFIEYEVNENIYFVPVVELDRAFSGLNNLKFAPEIPNTIKKIGFRSFTNCTMLQNITIPGSVEEVTDSVFEGCTALKSVVFEDGVRTIGVGAFRACTDLTNVTISGSVKEVGDEAFNHCNSISKVEYTGSNWDEITFGRYNETLINAYSNSK